MKIGTARNFFEGFFATFALAACLSFPAQARDFKIIVYGDSLMSGYKLQPEEAFAAKLERKLKKNGFSNVAVDNMSVPGDTTAAAAERINSVVVKRPDVVILELGANDALRGIAPNLIYQNLVNIMTKLYETRAVIVLVGMRAPANMGYNYTGQFENGYKTLAAGYRVPFYPFALEGVFGKADLNLADGFHPNAKGVDVMVDGIYPLVDGALRQKWSEVQSQDYQQQLLNTPVYGNDPGVQQQAPQPAVPGSTPVPMESIGAPAAPPQ